jgi:hypothetical protein
MFYGYVQQTGMYETMDLMICDINIPEYKDYYKNNDKWYMAKKSNDLKTVIEYLWFTFNDRTEVEYITINLEQMYKIDKETMKVMFAEKFLL